MVALMQASLFKHIVITTEHHFVLLQGIDESNEESMGELLTDSTAKLTSAVR